MIAGENGELTQVTGWVWLYWVLMVLVALVGISIQLADKRKHEEAYKFKGYFNSNMQSYASYADKLQSARYANRGGYNDQNESADDDRNYNDDSEDNEADFDETQHLNGRR